MDIYVLDDKLSVVGVIDQWESFIWVRKYREADSFELTLNINDKRLARLLTPQHYIARPDPKWSPDLFVLGYISSIRDRKNGETTSLIVSGYGAEGIFRKRLFPFWLSIEDFKGLNIKTLLQKLNPFGCRIMYTFSGGFNPDILNVPANYIEGNMEDYLRYLMDLDSERKYSYHVLLSYEPEESSLDQYYPTDVSYRPHQPTLYFLCEEDDNTPIAHTILSEGTDNFINSEYSFSEDGTYSKIYVRVNPDFNVSMTETTDEKDEYGDPITKTYNISYADIEDTILPEYVLDLTKDPENYSKINSTFMAITEHLMFVDPVIKKGQKTISGVSRWIKSEVPIGNCMISNDGTQYLVTPSEVVDVWYIDREETLKAMEKAARDTALIGTENFTGQMANSEIFSRNNLILGRIVLVRDDKRMRDYYKRVEEIEEVWDENGHSYQPTLGEPLKTIYDLIASR